MTNKQKLIKILTCVVSELNQHNVNTDEYTVMAVVDSMLPEYTLYSIAGGGFRLEEYVFILEDEILYIAKEDGFRLGILKYNDIPYYAIDKSELLINHKDVGIVKSIIRKIKIDSLNN